ncbi:MAG: hypothetical protein AAGC81_09910 [Pseudomonadota bacterium]
MSELLFAGALFGFVLGTCHAFLIVQTRRELLGGRTASSILPACGALFLWTLFGPYVMVMSLLAAVWFSLLQVRGTSSRTS